MEHAAVTVPASSANLGPGFDAFAVAIDLALEAWVMPRGERRVAAEGEGAAELPADDDNLVWRAFAAYCGAFGTPVPDVSLGTRNAIPLERGLGSSAAAAVAGVALARACAGAGGRDAGGRDTDLVELAAAIEGHPDNAAAAVLGGLVVCHDGSARRLEPSARLRPVLCVPVARQSTAVARALLPAHVAHAEAAANGARAAAVLAGLAGALAWDPRAMVDVLHEPARFAAMPDTAALVSALRAAGIGACLSGAGPTVLAIVTASDAGAVARVTALAPAGWQVLPRAWDLAGATVRAGA